MSRWRISILYATVFITGAVVLVIEIAGARLISAFFGATIYVWSSLIAATLGFLALGYLIGGRVATKYPSLRWFFGIVGIAGLSIIIVPKLYQPFLVLSDVFGYRFGPLVAATLLFIVPVTLLGMLSPYLVRLRTTHSEMVGDTTGKVFAYSTVGSLVGALMTGFYLVPNFSLVHIFTNAGILLVLLAVLGLYVFLKERELFSAVAAVCILTAAAFLPVYAYQGDAPIKITAHEHSFYADLKKVEGSGVVCLSADGATQSCRYGKGGKDAFSYTAGVADAVEAYGERVARPLSILIIGLGAGDLVPLMPEGSAVTVVEIDEVLAGFAKEHFGFALREGDELIIDDARYYLRTTDAVYDVIIGDAYNGHVIPAHLLTEEFFLTAAKRLAPDGLMVLNVNARPTGDDLLLTSVLKTMESAFASVEAVSRRAYSAQSLQNILIFASNGELSGSKLENDTYGLLLVDTGSGAVITDLQNGVELLNTVNGDMFRQSMLRFGGYTLLLP